MDGDIERMRCLCVQSVFTKSGVTWKIDLTEMVLDKAMARLQVGALGERLWPLIPKWLQTAKASFFLCCENIISQNLEKACQTARLAENQASQISTKHSG